MSEPKLPCLECLTLPSCRNMTTHQFVNIVCNCPYIIRYMSTFRLTEADIKVDELLKVLRKKGKDHE